MKKIIWSCIVEDPALFLRHFLEKLTNRERQVSLSFILNVLFKLKKVYFLIVMKKTIT